MDDYVVFKNVSSDPRLPLEGSIDLTYRCNNNCLHCWLRDSAQEKVSADELDFTHIRRIVDEARKMGCRSWNISGGEPMLRQDFSEIFDYITSNSSSYSLNTNGTLITPKIARLLKRKGNKMVALYGADAVVYDYITRSPGSFEALMAGFNYLKEAGAGFCVQLIPMKGNYHQFNKMEELAKSLSKHYRIGASWLYLSSCANAEKNFQIKEQRLPAQDVVKLDEPNLFYTEGLADAKEPQGCFTVDKEYHFASCIHHRRSFHIDPHGKMSFCSFIKDESMRYDLRRGSFQEGWDNFIPSLSKKIKVNQSYRDNCGACSLREHCRYCPVYGYLECGDYSAKVDYLCRIAEENKKFKENWQKKHRRYYGIGGLSIQVDSDLPIKEDTFHSKLEKFRIKGPAKDNIAIKHSFSLPDLSRVALGRQVYRRPPWAIYKNKDSWVYLGISPSKGEDSLHQVAVFNQGHNRAMIYSPDEKAFTKGGIQSLTMFPTDQILLARVLADKGGCFIHACGVDYKGKGLLFAGHSEAGKSTIATMFKGKAEILCDDRIIIRKQTKVFKIYGTWSHGDVPDISNGSASLAAILFLEKAGKNKLISLKDKKEVTRKILSCLIRPFITVDWWEKTLSIVGKVAEEIPCYILKFDKGGKVVDLLEEEIRK